MPLILLSGIPFFSVKILIGCSHFKLWCVPGTWNFRGLKVYPFLVPSMRMTRPRVHYKKLKSVTSGLSWQATALPYYRGAIELES